MHRQSRRHQRLNDDTDAGQGERMQAKCMQTVRVAQGVDPWPCELTMKKMIGQEMPIFHTPPRRPPQRTHPHLQEGVLTDPTYHRG